MTMILQLLVAAVAVGLTVAETPEYKQNLAALYEAAAKMNENILSMEGNIPLLNDSRRHYAEIVHVICDHGLWNSGGIMEDDYQQYLNSSAPEAIQNPENVIDEIKDLLVTVHNRTSKLQDLINACVIDFDSCNKIIDDTVKQHIDVYGPQARVLFAAGKVAFKLEKQNSQFEEVSRNLAAHQFVISTPQDLEDMREAVFDLLMVLFEPQA